MNSNLDLLVERLMVVEKKALRLRAERDQLRKALQSLINRIGGDEWFVGWAEEAREALEKVDNE